MSKTCIRNIYIYIYIIVIHVYNLQHPLHVGQLCIKFNRSSTKVAFILLLDSAVTVRLHLNWPSLNVAIA